MLAVFRAMPLLLLPALLYALVALPMGAMSLNAFLEAPAAGVTLPSGAYWETGRGDLIVFFAAAMLFIEIIKTTRPRGAALIENALAFLTFTGSLIFFLLVPAFGTMTFFMIMSMMLVDFMASAIVMVYMARRDVSFG